MTTPPAPDPLDPHVQQLLAEAFGGPVRLGLPTLLRAGRSARVLRYPIAEGPPSTPATVIAKAFGTERRPYDLDATDYGSPAQRFRSERHSLQVLGSLPGPPLAPRLYAAAEATGIVVSEDLGDGPSLADALQGGDSSGAEAALLAFAGALGRMHAATAGQPPNGEPTLVWDLPTMAAALDKARPALDLLGLTLPPGLDADLAAMDAVLTDPAFRALTHGDPCPDNTRLIDGRLLFFDFEDGEARHVLLDGVYLDLPFPSCWCWGRIPAAVARRARDAYRTALAAGCPAALDDRAYARATAAAMTAWLLAQVEFTLSGALEADAPWGLTTLRPRHRAWLDALIAACAGARDFPAIATFARDLAATLATRWPETPPEPAPYSAFA